MSTRRQIAHSSAAKRRKVDFETDPLDDEIQDDLSNDDQVHQATRSSKRPRMVSEGSSSTLLDDSNVCCVCFRTYEEDQEEETGFLWVKCVCQRWIHEDCYSEVVMDKNGRELICPYCVL